MEYGCGHATSCLETNIELKRQKVRANFIMKILASYSASKLSTIFTYGRAPENTISSVVININNTIQVVLF